MRLGLSPFRFSQMNHEYKRVPDKHQLGNLLKVFERSHGRGKAIEKALRRWGMPDCPVVVLANDQGAIISNAFNLKGFIFSQDYSFAGTTFAKFPLFTAMLKFAL